MSPHDPPTSDCTKTADEPPAGSIAAPWMPEHSAGAHPNRRKTDPANATASTEVRCNRPEPHQRESRRVFSRVAALLCAVVIAALAVAHASGYLTTVIVAGNSMEPAMHGGDLAIASAPGEYNVGDAVVLVVPEGEPGAGQRVVHRIISTDDGVIRTQGDNRDTADMWAITTADIKGRVAVVLDSAGLLHFLQNPLVIGGLAAVVTLAFLAPSLAPSGGDQPRRRRG
ncbi:MAG: signal peptidase I [Actinomycetia bacterium]|nr:signal peptidase I [Actinomycetes bacterium]